MLAQLLGCQAAGPVQPFCLAAPRCQCTHACSPLQVCSDSGPGPNQGAGDGQSACASVFPPCSEESTDAVGERSEGVQLASSFAQQEKCWRLTIAAAPAAAARASCCTLTSTTLLVFPWIIHCLLHSHRLRPPHPATASPLSFPLRATCLCVSLCLLPAPLPHPHPERVRQHLLCWPSVTPSPTGQS